MTAAVVASLAALAGVALGRFLDVWGESTKWLREHRSVAYAAYLGAVERYLSGVLAAEGSAEFRISTQGIEPDRIHGDLQVFGSEPARLAANRVREKLFGIHLVRPKQRVGAARVNFLEAAQSQVQDCQEAVDVLRSIMKSELRVKCTCSAWDDDRVRWEPRAGGEQLLEDVE